MSGPGRSAEDYGTPLFIAWQLTNHCNAHCLACCEESGPQHTWGDELTRDQAVSVAEAIVAAGVPYVAFGGGEPLGVAHCWEVFDILTAGGVSLKLETNGQHVDDSVADRLAALRVDCVQISVDGVSAFTHQKVRPGSSFAAAIGAIERLVARGVAPQSVFVPNRLNLHETLAAYDQAATLGCGAFVTGPMMRLGRAAISWERLACSAFEWQQTVAELRGHATRNARAMKLAIYPWDIVAELECRLDNPQAMLLIVPNGKVKMLNALPFAVADLRLHTLVEAWQRYLDAWHSMQVREFITACRLQPALLLHANATWTLQAKQPRGRATVPGP